MQLFTKEEIRDIIVSVVTVAFIFCYAWTGGLSAIGVFLLVVIVAFLFHELSHKFTAQKFGCLAVYKMFPQGLLIGLLFALIFGFAIVAPGAVVIYPFRFGRWKHKVSRLTVKEMGIISVVGIAVNLLFAAIFLPLSGTSGIWISKDLDLFGMLSLANAWLALFNLLPIPPLDGSKVFMWKIWLWAFLFVTAILIILLIYPFIVK